MNRYAAFGYVLRTPYELDFLTSHVGDRVDMTCGRSEPPQHGDLIHEAQDLPDGHWLRVQQTIDGVYLEYGDLAATLAPKNIITNRVPTPSEVERVILPIHRLTVRDDTFAWHASAVEWEEKAYVFLGRSGAGKSSTAHALTSMEFRLVADDMAIVSDRDHRPHILPAPPTSKLLQPPADAASIEPPSARSAKYRVSLHHDVGYFAPTPLAAIILLARDQPTQRVAGAHALQIALTHAFTLTQPSKSWLARRFKAVAAAVRNTDVYQFGVPTDPKKEPAHAAALSAWIKGGMC